MIESVDPNNYLWVEKYRPKTVAECILPKSIKDTCQEFVNKGDIPNLLLVGGPGCGKTTVAKAMMDELSIDWYEVNGSMNGNIDTLRNEIQNFASTISFTGNRKMVLIDEMDYLNSNTTQPALRNFMEAYSKNCGFIGTANYENRIIDPLRSRMSVIKFAISKKDLPDLAPEFLKRACSILDLENVEYDKKVVAAVIAKHFPDWRRVINELQRYSAIGKIDTGILTDFSEESFKSLIKKMRERKFSDCRKWIAENEEISTADFYRKFYDVAYDILESASVPQLVIHLRDYQLSEIQVPDVQINRAAFIVNCIADLEFKE